MQEILHTIQTTHSLGDALQMLRGVAAAKGSQTAALLGDIEADYQLMLDYMRRGFADTQRPEVYRRLLQRAYHVAKDLELEQRIQKTGAFLVARGGGQANVRQPEAVQARLEGFVQEVAMASLQALQQTDIYRRHHQYVTDVFNALLVSPQWSDAVRKSWCQLLVSPTIDPQDAALLTSAISLSCMNFFDPYKWATLADVYEQAADELLRQRALAGWAMGLQASGDLSIFPEVTRRVAALCQSADTCRELMELQLQVYLCNQADADHEAIQRDIMPSLLRNSRFHLTENGLVEQESDPLQDILDPDAEDRAMEELEQSVGKMMEMQQSGADIYFGGFSQMKRFPFFQSASHWFTPFYVEHPELGKQSQQIADTPFLRMLLNSGPFCDSDKYSFALAMAGILHRIPADVREMMESHAGDSAMQSADRESPAYIRRMYLQDAYRFFRLYQHRGDFLSPFADGRICFFLHPAFRDTALAEKFPPLAKFLLKKGQNATVASLLSPVAQHSPAGILLLLAMAALRMEDYARAKEVCAQVLGSQPHDPQALRVMAQACFHLQDYGEAERCYQELQQVHPEHRQLQLQLSIAQIYNNHAEAGMQTLHRMAYEQPDNVHVARALAWGHLMQGQPAQAEQVYGRLLAGTAAPNGNDLLNAGYAKWFQSKVEEAVQLFGRMLEGLHLESRQEGTAELRRLFLSDSRLLHRYGIGDTECHLMADLVQG